MSNIAPLWQQRYGPNQGPPAGVAESAVLDHLMAHRSVRAYSDRPLPEATLATLMAAAQSAASSSNLQAFSVVAVQDRERKARLSVLANNQAHIRQAPLFLVWLADLSRLDRNAARQGLPADANRYLEMFLVAAVDAALAAQNAALAAEALGLGTVYIGAMRNKPEDVARELKLPPNTFAVFGLCVGWPDPERPADIKPRLPQSLVVHAETYSAPEAEAAALPTYDAVMADFQRDQGMAETPWTLQAAQRVAGPGSLSGRDHLVQALKALGFGLD